MTTHIADQINQKFQRDERIIKGNAEEEQIRADDIATIIKPISTLIKIIAENIDYHDGVIKRYEYIQNSTSIKKRREYISLYLKKRGSLDIRPYLTMGDTEQTRTIDINGLLYNLDIERGQLYKVKSLYVEKKPVKWPCYDVVYNARASKTDTNSIMNELGAYIMSIDEVEIRNNILKDLETNREALDTTLAEQAIKDLKTSYTKNNPPIRGFLKKLILT